MKLVSARKPKRRVFSADGDSIVEIIILPDIFGMKPAAYIHKVHTDEEHRGKGYATKLVKEAIEYAQREGCYKAFLICHRETVPFYERCGMKESQAGMEIRL